MIATATTSATGSLTLAGRGGFLSANGFAVPFSVAMVSSTVDGQIVRLQVDVDE